MRYRTDRPEPRAHASCVRLQQLPGDFMSSTPFLREKGASDLSTAYSFMPHKQCPMADVLAGKVSGIYDAEVHIERADRSRVIVIVNIAPLVDDNGTIVGAVNSFCENPLRKRPK